MFVKFYDERGVVCVNMSSGLRFRPRKDDKTGLAAGVEIIFPDGNTRIAVRGDWERLTQVVDALDAR